MANRLQTELALHFIKQEHIVRTRSCDDQTRAIEAQRQHMHVATKLSTEFAKDRSIKGRRQLRVDDFERHACEFSDHGLHRALIDPLLFQDLSDAPTWRLLQKSFGGEQLLGTRNAALGKHGFKQRNWYFAFVAGHEEITHRIAISRERHRA